MFIDTVANNQGEFNETIWQCEDTGYRLASMSTTGLKKGQLRLSFLPERFFTKKDNVDSEPAEGAPKPVSPRLI